MARKLKVVVFDFDGVLVNTLEMSAAINEKLRPEMTREEFLIRHEGNVIEAFADHVVNSYHVFFEQYEQHIRHHEISPELAALVRKLAAQYTLAIVSSTPSQIIREHLTRHDLNHFFVEVLGGDIHADKTHKLQSLIARQGVSPSEMVLITDTLGDVREAEKASVPSIAVTWGFHDEKRLAKGNPSAFAHTPEELLEVITRAR